MNFPLLPNQQLPTSPSTNQQQEEVVLGENFLIQFMETIEKLILKFEINIVLNIYLFINCFIFAQKLFSKALSYITSNKAPNGTNSELANLEINKNVYENQ